MQTEYFASENLYPYLDETILTKYDVEKAIATIERLASDEKINITTLQISEVPIPPEKSLTFAQTEHSPFGLVITVNGDFEQIKSFLLKITNKRPLFNIDSVDLTGPTPDTPRDYLIATIRLQAYYYGPAKKSATDEDGSTEKKSSEESAL